MEPEHRQDVCIMTLQEGGLRFLSAFRDGETVKLQAPSSARLQFWLDKMALQEEEGAGELMYDSDEDDGEDTTTVDCECGRQIILDDDTLFCAGCGRGVAGPRS
jgi:hypothetical protein